MKTLNFSSALFKTTTLIFFVFSFAGCGMQKEFEFSGKTMGTTYHVKVVAGYLENTKMLKDEVDMRLDEIVFIQRELGPILSNPAEVALQIAIPVDTRREEGVVDDEIAPGAEKLPRGGKEPALLFSEIVVQCEPEDDDVVPFVGGAGKLRLIGQMQLRVEWKTGKSFPCQRERMFGQVHSVIFGNRRRREIPGRQLRIAASKIEQAFSGFARFEDPLDGRKNVVVPHGVVLHDLPINCPLFGEQAGRRAIGLAFDSFGHGSK